MFACESGWTCPTYLSSETFEDYINLLLLMGDTISHYVYIKYCEKFRYTKTKYERKNTSADITSNVFVVKKYWYNIKRCI